MTKRIVVILILVCFVFCLFGCNSVTSDKKADTLTIEQTESDYIFRTDWMTFYFSKQDFNESDIAAIAAEAVSVMLDIRTYLKANYTLEEARESVCYFDSSYRNESGGKRSQCYWNERKMYCVSLGDFVHEYVHMVSENNVDLVYSPSKLFSEGLAEYVSLNFYDCIASQEYMFFKEEAFSEDTNATEHQAICELLSNNELEYNQKNYYRGFVAILYNDYDISKIDKNTDIYRYIVGYIFVDYCVAQLGGIDKFMSVYCDSVTITDVYEKSVDALIAEACIYNNSLFTREI
ncbi:MAG: hypothetical protein E7653_05110 [Ruminococcaceae bacterium]|nr:hypothetical protein [Oscillospiraceae bacterium]